MPLRPTCVARDGARSSLLVGSAYAEIGSTCVVTTHRCFPIFLVTAEPEVLIGRQRPVVQETGGHRVGGLGIAFHGPPAERRDQVQRPSQRCGSHALTAVSFADVTTPDPPIGPGRLTLFVGGTVLDPWQLLGPAELAPAQTVIAAEDERGVCSSRAHTLQLPFAIQVRCGSDALRVHSDAPTAAKNAVVTLHQRGESWPGRLVKRSNLIGGGTHATNVTA